jgi:hypothetical protein
MMKAIVVDEENIELCKELLNVVRVPRRAIEEPTWIVWGNELWPEVKLLPHAIFRDKYNVVGHEGDYIMIVEKI